MRKPPCGAQFCMQPRRRLEAQLLGQKGPKNAARSAFESSVLLLANVVAFAIAMLGTGPVYSWSVVWVRGFAVTQYGPDLAALIEVLWAVVVALTIFAFARASVATLITLGGLALAARMFA